nr:hypothetical protein [Tanacetum cinerariifolium]
LHKEVLHGTKLRVQQPGRAVHEHFGQESFGMLVGHHHLGQAVGRGLGAAVERQRFVAKVAPAPNAKSP